MVLKGIVLIIVYLILKWLSRFLFIGLLIKFIQRQISKGVDDISKKFQSSLEKTK
ncbi:MAG: hypothetical protein N4A68_07485 [Maledivibacter sp.]|jgi:hypothetical protein|nr:hypothetical protein [Maledivibacter sp.]